MENKVIKTIKSRVSCRNFSNKKVELSIRELEGTSNELIDENEVVENVKNILKDKFDEVYETQAGATISSHCGLETIGILFLDK